MENRTNTIELDGRILSKPSLSHVIHGKSFLRFDIDVGRFSGQSDMLPVTVSKRIIGCHKMLPGQAIKVKGQIRSYDNYVEAEGKKNLVITVFAHKISLLSDVPDESLNCVCLDGFLCKPPIYRTKHEISHLMIAVNRSYNKSDYLPCIAWGINANFASKLQVGERIRVSGRMQSRQYNKILDDETILRKTAYEVSVSKIEIVKEETEATNDE